MVTETYDCLGLTLKIQVPRDVAEFDANAKRVGACLENAVDNVVYRGVLNRARPAFVKLFSEKTGVSPRTIEETVVVEDGSTKTVTKRDPRDTDDRFIKRVLAERGETIEQYQSLMDTVPDVRDAEGNLVVVFDASKAERQVKSPTIPKRFVEAAKVIVEKGFGHKFMAKHSIVLPAGSTAEAELAAIAAKVRDLETKSAEELASKYAK